MSDIRLDHKLVCKHLANALEEFTLQLRDEVLSYVPEPTATVIAEIRRRISIGVAELRAISRQKAPDASQ